MRTLIKVENLNDIPAQYRNTPFEQLIAYHNLNLEFEKYDRAQMIVGMCMDNRKHLHIPENFSYIIRTGGANLRYSEFRLSYAIAIGGVRALALIGHNNCGMVNLMGRKNQFIQGLIDNAGWTRDEAEEHFYHYEPVHEIGNEIDFILSEVKRIRLRYPKIIVAPLFYDVDDNKLSFINEEVS